MKSCLFENIELTGSFGTIGGIIVDEVSIAVLLRLVFGYHYFGEVTTAPHNNKYSAYGLFYDYQFITQEFVDKMLGVMKYIIDIEEQHRKSFYSKLDHCFLINYKQHSSYRIELENRTKVQFMKALLNVKYIEFWKHNHVELKTIPIFDHKV